MRLAAADRMLLPGAEPHDHAAASDLDVVAAVLGETVEAFDQADVPYLLIGGLASALLGRPRCSTDVDLLVRPVDAPRALDALGKRGFRTERINPHWLYKAFRRDVLVDLLFQAKGGIYLDDEMLRRATLRYFRGVSARVVCAEDLIVMKAIVHDEETPRHWFDALAMVAAGIDTLDWDYLLERARFGPRRLLSLLSYASSVDLHVPHDALRRLACVVIGDKETPWSRPT
jgi:predicted nucleotidyltransferase